VCCDEFACIKPFAGFWFPALVGRMSLDRRAVAVDMLKEWIARAHGAHPAFRGGDYLLIQPPPGHPLTYAMVAIFSDWDDDMANYEQLLVGWFTEDAGGTIDSIVSAIRSQISDEDYDKHCVRHPV
jgi:hypothetical protein